MNEKTKLELKSLFMVDINAIAVNQMDEVQYYLLFITNTAPQDSDKITYIMTQNSRYKTKEGIKVGSTIKDAEAIYGKATLAYNTENESREYVEFERFPSSPSISFRPNSTDREGFAGIYAENKSYNQTENYRDDAKIDTIEVTCTLINCP